MNFTKRVGHFHAYHLQGIPRSICEADPKDEKSQGRFDLGFRDF
jgi:hypothetical protein